ncbi:MAG: HAD family hydrolase [Candidatus Micrarchaeota archaeon]|nr:HAD family hydrolase [Candidatus Micrarchaeota archaeon]
MTEAKPGRIRRNNIFVIFDMSGTLFEIGSGSPLPGAMELVREMHDSGIRIAVSTSMSAHEASALLSGKGVADCFDAIVGEHHHPTVEGRLKIALASFTSRKTNLPIPNREVFVIDDRASRVEPVVKMGFKFIGVCTGESTRSDFERGPYKPFAVFDDLWNTSKVIDTVLSTRTHYSLKKTRVPA